MVTGASTADLALLLVDARKGVLTQTRRHSYLAHLLGIRRFVLAVNKMDLVDFDQGAFDAIAAEYRDFAKRIGIEQWLAIPVSAAAGDNVTAPERRDAVVRWADAARPSQFGAARCRRRCGQSRSGCRCNG